MELTVAILAVAVIALALVALELWSRVRMLEAMAAGLSPAHSVDAVERRMEKLEAQTAEGFSKAAQALHALNAQTSMVMAAVKLQRAEAEETYVKRGEVN